MQTRLVVLKCHQSNQIKCSRGDKYSGVQRSKGETTHYTTSRLLHMRFWECWKNENTQDPIFSWTVTSWQMCTQDLETAAIFSWTALLSKTRLWRFWLGCSLWGGGERERQRGTERGRVSGGWESGGGGVLVWEPVTNNDLLTGNHNNHLGIIVCRSQWVTKRQPM